MYALIRRGNGKYYGSPIFGCYNDVKSDDRWKRYDERLETSYYVLFNPERTRLIKQLEFQQNTRYIIQLVLIVDSDKTDWIQNEDGTGGMKFLPRDIADEAIKSGVTLPDILKKCQKYDEGFIYNEYPEIHTEKDIENLDVASGWFHDGRIKEHKILEDGSLYLYFDGTWGCHIEIWLWGELDYNLGCREPDSGYDPYWGGSTILLQDGFIWFIDDDDMKVEDISEGY